MKPYETQIGGHKLIISVPETATEFDTLAKKEGACVEAAVDYEIFHSTLGVARKALINQIEKIYGAKPREIGTGQFEEKDGKRVEITKDEKFDVFLTRVAAEKELEGEAPFQDIVNTLSAGGPNEVKIDPTPSERKPGSGPKLSKLKEAQAANFIDAAEIPGSGGRKFSLSAFSKAYHKMIGKDLPPLTGDRATDIKTVGFALLDYEREEANKKFAGMAD